METPRYLKQIIVMRKDLSMPTGKFGAMCAHASMTFLIKKLQLHELPDGSGKFFSGVYLTADEARWCSELDPGLEEHKQESMAKIVCAADNEAHLLQIEVEAKQAGLQVFRVVDSGHSHNKPGTLVGIGIGPDWPEKLAPVTGKLKVYR